MGRNADVKTKPIDLVRDTAKFNYSYNFEWMERPIIHFPLHQHPRCIQGHQKRPQHAIVQPDYKLRKALF